MLESKMLKVVAVLCVFANLIAITPGYEISDIASARIESCSGCSLNRLKEVKTFIYDDAPKYENVEVKFIHGRQPELILLDSADSELERVALNTLNRQECNELLKSKGFQMKDEGAGGNKEL